MKENNELSNGAFGKLMNESRGIVSFLLTSEIAGSKSVQEWEEELGSLAKENGYGSEFLLIIPDNSLFRNPIINSSFEKYPTQVILYEGSTGWDEDLIQLLSYANGDYVFVVSGELENQKNIFNKLINEKDKSDILIYSNKKLKTKINKLLLFFIKNNFHNVDPLRITKSILLNKTAYNFLASEASEIKNYFEIFFYNNLHYKMIFDLVADTKIMYSPPKKHFRFLIFNYSNLPMTILSSMMVSNVIVFLLTSINAVLVNYQNINIFGESEEQVKGWASIVIMISFGFISTTTMLYLSLSDLMSDKKNKKRYRRSNQKIYRF